MGNRKKTNEQRLRRLAANNPRRRDRAQEELSKIELFKQYAELGDAKMKEN